MFGGAAEQNVYYNEKCKKPYNNPRILCDSGQHDFASQYVAILIPGRMYLPAYDKLGVKRMVASRTCEDAATVTFLSLYREYTTEPRVATLDYSRILSGAHRSRYSDNICDYR